jgi:hypothetical protein
MGRFRVKYCNPSRFYSRKLLPLPISAPQEHRSEGLGPTTAASLRPPLLTRLNGWQRVFVVVAVIWLALVGAIAVSAFPRESQVWDRYAYALLEKIRTTDDTLKQQSTYELRQQYGELPSSELVSRVRAKYTTTLEVGYVST